MHATTSRQESGSTQRHRTGNAPEHREANEAAVQATSGSTGQWEATATPMPSPLLRRSCACGGGCPRCAAGNAAFAPVAGMATAGGNGRPAAAAPMRAHRPPVQAKLEVGAQDDPFEREADAVADRVLSMPVPSGAGDAGPPRITPLRASTAATAQRSAGGEGRVSNGVRSSIDALRGGGIPLRADARAFFEPRFGRDLSAVRLHTGATAARTASALSARAFTVGSDIVFGEHEYRPGNARGDRLLAHELAHTVQQGAVGERIQRIPADLDIKRIARSIFDAIDGPGTDEEAVYGALQQLDRDPGAIDLLKETYLNEYKLDLVADIRDDFSDEELEYALQLINIGTIGSDQRIERGPNAVVGTATAIERLWAATDRIGTDEEAIFATLLPYGRNTAELEDAFRKRYGESLRSVLVSELSGSELDYALSLMAPEGERKSIADKLSPTLIESHFAPDERDLAGRILRDLLAVRQDRLDFENEQELVDEIRKRLRTSKLMQDSQVGTAFGYPESLPASCPGYSPDVFQQATVHARVNKAAKPYWQDPILDPTFFYIFRLNAFGREHATDSINTLFVNQSSFCDRTLIHCDYLINVIHFRAYAESLGAPAFDDLVRGGKLDPVLTFTGFEKPPADNSKWPAMAAKSPMAWSLQWVRPASEDDLVIGDHVIFWNHLAYDSITMASPGPWRLENALLVDKDASGRDLYEGHGAPEISPNVVGPGSRDLVLRDLMKVYNDNVEPAIDLAREVDAGADPGKQLELAKQYPRVAKNDAGEWLIHEREDRDENKMRKRRTYPLRKLSGIGDPDLIGLRDPEDPTRMGVVKRPVESAKGPKPSP
jgi:hypothetical protein